ncbi:MAG: hypothetical protein ACKOTB_17000 [Planctomycetia bacterium]
MRDMLRRFLAWGVTLSIVLPMVAVVSLGLGGLLASLGDGGGAVACRRVGLIAGVVWFMALATTATAGGIVAYGMLTNDPHAARDGAVEPPRGPGSGESITR